MRAFLGATAACLLTTAASAQTGPDAPRPDLPLEGAVSNPHWLKLPDADAMSRYYPPFAVFMSLQGRVRVSCVVTTSGSLSDCRVVSEVPAGFGFGAAALNMTDEFEMAPRTVDGAPVGGARVNIPLRFGLPDKPEAPSQTPPSGPPPTAAKLVLARKLAALAADDVSEGSFKALVDQLTDQLNGQQTTPEARLAVDAIEKAVAETAPSRTEWNAQFFARTLPPDQMREIIAFLSKPAGRNWLARSAELKQAEIASNPYFRRMVLENARARLCGQIACVTEAEKAR
jgi:TonB family protein